MKHCLFLLLLLASVTAPAAEPIANYVMSYITESPNGLGNAWSLHLATSEDGLNWMPLNQNEPVLVPDLGEKGLSDPFILRKQDGGFVVLATNLTGTNVQFSSPAIHVWDSDDLITFKNGRLLQLHDTAMHTWAPKAFYDPVKRKYGIIWSGNADYNRTYVNYTDDFINVSPHELFFDPGYEVIDVTLRLGGGENYLYYKDVRTGTLRGARSRTLAPRSFDRGAYADLGATAIQAPVVVKDPLKKRWFLYGDFSSPVNGEFYAWETSDITKGGWQELYKRDYNLPLNFGHANVIAVTRPEIDRLIQHWGRPQWHRIKPYNQPDHFVRHANYKGVISPYPFDPYQDSQWKVLPGLADEKGVSFEAFKLPGYFLRHVGADVLLAKDDGSADFKASATFLKEPGITESSWSSFQIFDAPGKYLRHANYVLHVEVAETFLEQEDSTFRLVY